MPLNSDHRASRRLLNLATVFLLGAVIASDSASSRENEKGIEEAVRIRKEAVTGIGHEAGVCRRDPSDVIRLGDLHFVFYTKLLRGDPVYPEGYFGTVWYATSADGGRAWRERGPVIAKGEPGSFDSFGVFTPNVMRGYDGSVYVYYTGVGDGFDNRRDDYNSHNRTAIGAARIEIGEAGELLRVEKLNGGDPLLRPSPSADGAFDSFRVDDAAIVLRGERYWLYYKGRAHKGTPGRTRMGLAIAERPEGPYVRQNGGAAVQPEGHEVLVWEQGEGVVSLVTNVGRGLYFARDGLGFSKIRDELSGRLRAPGAYRPELTDPDAKGAIEWGVHMATYAGDPFLERFELELPSLSILQTEPVLRPGAIATVTPVPSAENRASAAGWGKGTWLDQHEAINRIGDAGATDLVFLGDSITQSWGGPGREVGSPGAKIWNELYGDRRAANFGISGDRTQHVLWRIDNGNFEGVAPSAVVLMIGTNNLAHDSAEDIAAGVSAVVERLRNRTPDAVVLLCAIVRGESPADLLRRKANRVNELIRPLGERPNVRFVDLPERFYLTDQCADPSLMRQDFVHFSEAGYRKWAEMLEPHVDGLLGAAASGDELELIVEPLPTQSRATLEDHRARPHILADPEWFTWGAGVILGEDARYHMFYSRWPRKLGFLAWLTHSEVAHAVADRPEGPYRYVDTALTARGAAKWNRVTAHNPKIKRFEGKYYLYYISTNGDYSENELIETARVGYRHPRWKVLRENQRTGVAVAESLAGPWRRSETPIVEPAGPITTLTVNPAVTRGPDGTYFMIIKGDKPNETRFVRNQALATAPSPVGPFTIQAEPVIDTLDTEDASIWYDDEQGRYYAVFHAHDHIGLITSRDGYDWSKARHYRASAKQVAFADGTTWKPDRLERPFVLTDAAGQPFMLFLAARKGDLTCNVHLRLRSRNQ